MPTTSMTSTLVELLPRQPLPRTTPKHEHNTNYLFYFPLRSSPFPYLIRLGIDEFEKRLAHDADGKGGRIIPAYSTSISRPVPFSTSKDVTPRRSPVKGVK